MITIPDLQTALLDLLYEVRDTDIKLIIGGGFGIYLKTGHVRRAVARTLFSEWPEPRSTNDLDLFLRPELIIQSAKLKPLAEYSDTRLGDALRDYDKVRNEAHDHYISDENIFGSPAEKELYALIVQTPFFRENQDKLRLIAQFEIGKYIRQEYHRYIPKYRMDFLLTKTDGGKEKSLIIEYDGLEFHTRNPEIVTAHNFDREYLEYDVERQLELESYGYSFLRINKLSLVPLHKGESRVAVLNAMLEESFK